MRMFSFQRAGFVPATSFIVSIMLSALSSTASDFNKLLV